MVPAAAIILLVLLVYLGTSFYLQPKMKEYVRRNLSESLQTLEISFNLMPFSVTLEESTIEPAPKSAL